MQRREQTREAAPTKGKPSVGTTPTETLVEPGETAALGVTDPRRQLPALTSGQWPTCAWRLLRAAS